MRPSYFVIAYLGAIIRWFLEAIFRTKNRSFNTVLYGDIRSDKWSETTGNNTVNAIFGYCTVLFILIWLGSI